MRPLGDLAAFLPYCRKVVPTLVALVLATSLQSIALLMLPMVYRIVYDDFAVTLDRRFLAVILAYVGAFMASAAVFTALVDAAAARLRSGLAAIIRRRLFSDLLAYRMEFLLGRETGGLVQNLIADIDVIAGILSQAFQVAAYLLQIALLFALLAWMDRDFLLLFAGILAAYLAWTLLWRGPVERTSGRIGAAYGDLYAFLFEALPGIREIKLNGLQGYALRRLGRSGDSLQRQQMANALSNTLLWSAALTVPWISFGALLVLAAGKLEAGTLSIGTLSTLFVLMWGMFSPVDKFSAILNALSNALPAAKRVKALVGDYRESPGRLNLDPRAGDIEFQDVSFAHAGGRKALDGVSFRIPKGSRVAVVGRSGSGKSTLAALLTKFHEGYDGRILVGGADIRELGPESVRSAICLLAQDIYLFNDTVKGNIDFEDALPHSEVARLCELAQLSGFLSGLPRGLDSPVGERGAKMSGGEKQRLAIARVLARSAGILVLDEATSALDPETDRKVRASLEAVRKERGMTLLSITHRAEAARDSDFILVLDGGRIAERGTHEELLARKGLYHALFTEQAQGRREAA